MKQAFEQAQDQKTAGELLTHLFQNALTVGKRVRCETAIGKGCVSVSKAAVELILQSVENTTDLNALIVGTGKMSILAAKALRKHGINDMFIVNRTQRHAVELANELGAKGFGFQHLKEALQKADVVLTCTGAPDIVMPFDLMKEIVTAREGRPLLMIDIAVPRDIAAEVGELPNVTLFNLDHLKATINSNMQRKQKEVHAAREIVVQEVTRFLGWYTSLEVKPLISDLRRHAEDIRSRELERSLKRFERDLSVQDAAVVQELTNRIVNKILHRPFVRLKEEAEDGSCLRYGW